MSGNAIAAALSHVPSLRNPFSGGRIPDFAILLEISRTWGIRDGEECIDDWLQSVLAEIWQSDPALLEDVLCGPSRETWALRHALSEGVKNAGHLIALDLSFKRGDIMRFCRRMRTELPSCFPGGQICEFGHVGDGGVHFNVVIPRGSPNAGDPSYETRLRSWIYEVVVGEYGGSFSAEHSIGRKNQAFYDRFTDERLKTCARALKMAMSPGDMGVPKFW